MGAEGKLVTVVRSGEVVPKATCAARSQLLSLTQACYFRCGLGRAPWVCPQAELLWVLPSYTKKQFVDINLLCKGFRRI